MKKKGLVLSSIAAALVVTASIGSAFAYFSTYAEAKGGYVIKLGDYEEYTEEFQDWEKNVVITSRSDSNEDVYVRVKAFAGDAYTLTYSGDGKWTPAADGYYYYSDILTPGASTTGIKVHIGDIPADVDTSGFNVLVVYECTSVRYDEKGNPYADWNQVLDTTTVPSGKMTGGEN